MKRTLKHWNGTDIAITLNKEYEFLAGGIFLDDEGDSRSITMGVWENAEEEATMTPAQSLGMEVGGIYRLNHKGSFYDSPFVLVKLVRDDASRLPMFNMLEGPATGANLWIDLDWIMKSPLTRKAAEASITNVDNSSRTEGENTMATQTRSTPATEAGLSIGDKVRLIEADIDAEVGDILTFSEDDRTASPYFEDAEGRTFPVMIRKVEKLEDETKPTLEQIEVGGSVQRGDTVFLKDGRRTYINSDQACPDSDDEYSTDNGYEEVSDIEMICRIVKPEPKKREVTIELTNAEIEALREAEAKLVHPEIDDMYSTEHRKTWVSILDRLYRAA